MNIIPNIITRKVARAALTTRVNSPSLLFGAGVALGLTSVVLACRATLRVEEVVEDTKTEIEKAQLRKHEGVSVFGQDVDKQIWQARAIGARKIAVLYAPSVLLGLASIGAFAQSNRILTRRNAVLAAAYTALDKSLREYRQRVREMIGDDQEEAVYHHIGQQRDEEGKPLKDGKFEYKARNPYSLIYDTTLPNWKGDPEMNLATIEAAEIYCNRKLERQGHLFLNEVFDALGAEHTEIGSFAGWLSKKEYPEEAKDGYVDFGLDDDRQSVKRFLAGHDASVVLNFNCDPGMINKFLKKRH